jgi:hypothetical protein
MWIIHEVASIGDDEAAKSLDDGLRRIAELLEGD